MNQENLINEIITAFSGVVLGKGIGLWEAQAIDDYETEEVRQEKRKNDEKMDWSRLLGYSELQRCHSSLSFFDADGMKFHLPVFMIGSIKKEVDDPIFHLTSLDEYSQSRFTTLNLEQRKAVVSYLNWCLKNDDYQYDHPPIERAINEYWKKRI
ncbi:MAG: hypothetical protein PQ612_02555 [Rickettsiales bacterium]|nr:hypothetical protein [Pseudomonadota bacterium]MDA0966006.1 hypothetical protein [Pseudomonadota bacterium]MDG4542523.1 hypothetical protein [Rickettsiales bacterium]MDG4545027.1 hypothetical protein [Rickettsiales bacterium]MDG4547150.1 hypothetical protein [Rickettsiales bacterium]